VSVGERLRLMGWEEKVGWALLAALLLVLLFGSATCERRPLLGDEPTYVLQAASLAWDFDLAFTRADHDRFVEQWGTPPAGVLLQSRDGGGRITYAKPFLYALLGAPFVRLAPVAGLAVLNALLLAAAALAAALALRPRLGPATPVWVAVLLFASVAFAYAYRLQADALLFAATVGALALVYGERSGRDAGAPLPDVWDGGEGVEEEGRPVLRWALAGALLAIPVAFRPPYLLLFLPAVLARPPQRRMARLLALAVGGAAVLALTAVVQWAAGGGWSPYLGERMAFFPRTGFPGVEVAAERWPDLLLLWGSKSWEPGGALVDLRLDPRLWGWNLLYLLIGRTVGLLPYFLPAALCLALGTRERGRWSLPLAAGLGLLAFALLRPFDLAGGAGAIADRNALPLYAALWFCAARPLHLGPALAIALLAAPFLHPLWLHARSPLGTEGEPRYVSAAARLLPVETTQSGGPGTAGELSEGIWVRPLDDNAWRGGHGLRLLGDARAALLVGSAERAEALLVDVGREASTRLEVNGRELRPTVLRGDGGLVFRVPLGKPRAAHSTAWSRAPVYFYPLELRLAGARPVPIRLEITPERDRIERSVE
jgi:hypothetical protein